MLADYRTAPISEKERALFRLLDRLSEPSAVQRKDVDEARAAGWTDEAIYDAITVCALFHFYNRWIDGTGVADMSPEAYAMSGKRLAQGYTRK